MLAVNVVPVAVVLERPAWNCAALVSSELAPPPKNKLLNFCSLRLKYNCEVNRESNAPGPVTRLAAEVPSSQKAHFASLRADELKIGKLDSDYAPPLSPRVRDQTPEESP